jgi:hypothetical protein
LLDSVKELIIPFIRSADPQPSTSPAHASPNGKGIDRHGEGRKANVVDYKSPQELSSILDLALPTSGRGKDGLLDLVKKVLKFSVNTWDQGFMDKLYASTNAVSACVE